MPADRTSESPSRSPRVSTEPEPTPVAKRSTRPIYSLGFATLDPLPPSFMAHGYLTGVIDGVIRGANLLEHDLNLLVGHRTSEIAFSLPHYLKQCDGLIHLSFYLSVEAQEAIRKAGLPIVGIGGPGAPEWPMASVDIDNVKAGRDMANHLISLGHRRLAIVLKDDEVVSQHRLQGFRQALQGASICLDAGNVLVGGGYNVSAGGEVAARVFRRSRSDWPTGIVCYNDTVALGILAYAADKGISVPRELSVTGMDDIMDARLSRPGLTTIRQPLREIGIAAVQLLVDIISGEKRPDHQMSVPFELVVRGSTAAPRSV